MMNNSSPLVEAYEKIIASQQQAIDAACDSIPEIVSAVVKAQLKLFNEFGETLSPSEKLAFNVVQETLRRKQFVFDQFMETFLDTELGPLTRSIEDAIEKTKIAKRNLFETKKAEVDNSRF